MLILLSNNHLTLLDIKAKKKRLLNARLYFLDISYVDGWTLPDLQ